jgi:thermitase
MRKFAGAVIAILILVLPCDAMAGTPPDAEIIPGRIIVHSMPDELQIAGQFTPSSVSYILQLHGYTVLEVPIGMEESIIADLKAQGIQAESDTYLELFDIPNDPLVPEQWALTAIDAFTAWDTPSTGSAVIAIIDTGIDLHHADLASHLIDGYDFVDMDSDPSPGSGEKHGTHVAGIAAAVTNNGQGIAGICRNCRIMPLRVCRSQCPRSATEAAIYWAADHGADVINLSLGSTTPSDSLCAAISYAWQKGLVIAASAGNSGNSTPVYPAACPDSLAVGATDENNQRATFSSYGSWVEIAAPGASILSTVPGSDYSFWSGTSMAAPHVAGLAGLLKSAYSGWSNQQIVGKMEETAHPISGLGHGLIDAADAMGQPILEVYGVVKLQARGANGTNHSGVIILIDGVPRTKTDASGSFRVSDLSPGSHAIEASHPFYLSAKAVIQLSGASIEMPSVMLYGGNSVRQPASSENKVDIFDLSMVGVHYGETPPTDPRADMNGDGRVDIFDLTMVGANYGMSDPQPWQ